MKRVFFLNFIILLFICQVHSQEEKKSSFFTQASLIYWQAEEGGLAYAVKTSTRKRDSVQNLKFEWDPGFNVGFGYQTAHDEWEVLLQFTHFQTHADSQESARENSFFVSSWQVPFTTVEVIDALKAHWRLHLGLIDLLLKKPIFESHSFTLIPEIGIRWGSIRQKYNIDYRKEKISPKEDLVLRMKNKYWGIGPIMGMTGEYALLKTWSIFGHCAFDLLYGQFYIHQSAHEEETKQKLLGIRSIYDAGAVIFDASAGVRWKKTFLGTLKHLMLEIAWDQLVLFSQNQFLQFVDNLQPGDMISNQGDLSIAGVHFNIVFAF